MSLKPNEEIMTAAAVAAVVVGIFTHDVNSLADIQHSSPGGSASANTHSAIKKAAATSAALVAGLGLLAKDPTIYIVGALVTVVEAWKLMHANVTGPNGQVAAPGASTTGLPTATLNQ